MIDYITLGINSARSNTRISTFLLDAGFVGRAFRVDDTFRSAVRRRPYISRKARASLMPSHDLTNGISTTWSRLAWNGYGYDRFDWKISKKKCINFCNIIVMPKKTEDTSTVGRVCNYVSTTLYLAKECNW